ncbi:PTS transporter subunit EIIA [Jiella sp. 40Bstr34]|uniref:PTS transporter subunit EIIA n=1 Tax=Jiella pacifica TaxID=2696469 RepID=A0A6N9T659_9HYPH|nr:PTS transporter subunit EIIA [Jiella pacifica]
MKRTDVLLGVSASSKPKLLQFLAQTTAKALDVGEDEILNALACREELGSTGIGEGIALPHAQVRCVVAPFVLLVRLVRPIEFEAIDDRPVDLICLILTPPANNSSHLQLLSNAARQLRCPNVIMSVRSASDPDQVYEALTVSRE